MNNLKTKETRSELYLTKRNIKTGQIQRKQKITIDELKSIIFKEKYFNHFFFGLFRTAVAIYVFDYLENLKHDR